MPQLVPSNSVYRVTPFVWLLLLCGCCAVPLAAALPCALLKWMVTGNCAVFFPLHFCQAEKVTGWWGGLRAELAWFGLQATVRQVRWARSPVTTSGVAPPLPLFSSSAAATSFARMNCFVARGSFLLCGARQFYRVARSVVHVCTPRGNHLPHVHSRPTPRQHHVSAPCRWLPVFDYVATARPRKHRAGSGDKTFCLLRQWAKITSPHTLSNLRFKVPFGA